MAHGYSQPAGYHDVADVPRWRVKYWKQFPFRSTFFLVGAVVAAFASLLVLYLANDQPTNDPTWKMVPPSVCLSILAVVSRSLAQAAFQSGADTFWWDQLLSRRAAKLSDLHHTWMFSREVLPLFRWHRPWNLVRSAGLSVLVLGVVGPLLQQSVSTELVTKTSRQPATLPIRTEPMWNLTVLNTNFGNGWGWSIPMYQPEFASIALDHTQHRAPILTGSGFCRGNCTANITIAGFARNCTERLTSPDGLPYLKPAQRVVLMDRDRDSAVSTHVCTTLVTYNGSRVPTGKPSSDSSYCGLFQTYYQLSVETVRARNPTDLPTLLYTSYVRPVAVNNSLLVQQCNFSTAFLTMTVDLANDSSVALSSQYGLPQDRVVEPIGSPTNDTAQGVLAGFLQAMRDSYEGYVLWDTNEGSNILLGNGPRLYGNTTNLNQTVVTQPGTNASLLAVPFRSPLEDFTKTLNEMALRYALTAMPNDAARVKANEDYFGPGYTGGPWDRRNKSIPKTRLSKSQSVVLEESRTVAVFRVNYAYAVGASCVVLLSALATAPLLSGWRRAGRDLSVSPLEVANAFDAPLLAGVPSGAPVGTVLRAVDGVEVRYGEPRAGGYGEIVIDEYMVQESTEGDVRRRLVIGRADEVVPPEAGVKYTG